MNEFQFWVFNYSVIKRMMHGVIYSVNMKYQTHV